jgi:hypothetical protein
MGGKMDNAAATRADELYDEIPHDVGWSGFGFSTGPLWSEKPNEPAKNSGLFAYFRWVFTGRVDGALD